jgi:hypothetical protein
MARGDSYQLQGQQGGVVINAGGGANGPFRWIQVINDTVLDSIGDNDFPDAGLLMGPTLPAGVGIGGRFGSIDVLTGLVIAYYA